MRKLSVWVTALAFVLTACNSDKIELEQPTGDLHEVVFNVSTFAQEIEDLNQVKVRAANLDGIKDISWIITDRSGTNVIKQGTFSDPAHEYFGVIREALFDGDYTIYVRATTYSSVGSISPSKGSISINGYLLFLQENQLFATKKDFAIKGMVVTSDLVLNRITGMLKLTITDEIPDYITRIDIDIDKSAQTYYFDPEKPSADYTSCTYTYRNSEYNFAGLSNQSLTFHALNMKTGNSTIKIKAYKDNTVIAEKSVYNVGIYANKKTTLTGKLFDNNAPNFNIKAEQEWSTEEINMAF